MVSYSGMTKFDVQSAPGSSGVGVLSFGCCYHTCAHVLSLCQGLHTVLLCRSDAVEGVVNFQNLLHLGRRLLLLAGLDHLHPFHCHLPVAQVSTLVVNLCSLASQI